MDPQPSESPSTSSLVDEYLAALAEIREYSDDPTVSGFHTGGRPPEGHVRRCHGRCRRTQRRCWKWALDGRDYCQMHGGHNPRNARKLPMRYKKRLMPALAEALERQMSDPDALALYEEIGLARVFLEEQCALAGALLSSEQVTLAAKVAAASMVREATTHVADLCAKMAAIERSRKDAMPMQQLGYFVEQVAKLMHRRLGDSTTVDEIADEIKRGLQLPSPDDDTRVEIQFSG